MMVGPTMKKTSKTVLAKRLEEKVSATESVSVPSLTIIDGMSLIHKLPGENRTFSEVCHQRLSRGSSDVVQFTQILPAHRIKNSIRILTSQSSKKQLIKFIAADWKQSRIRERLGSKVLELECNEKCFRITH